MTDEFELDGFGVRNIEVEGKQAIRIKAEGEEECVREFEAAVKTRRPEGTVVSGVRSETFDGCVPSIERTAITNMNLQLAKGITALNKIVETQEDIAATQRETLTEIKGIRQDLVIDRGWQSRVDRDIKDIKAKIGLS
jgi:hypothetical protein